MREMYKLQFHPVWEDKLSFSEKHQYEEAHVSVPYVENECTISQIRIVKKENDGMVATVFINNGFPHDLLIEVCEVAVKSDDGTVFALGHFQPDLHIDVRSSLPWSFVFSKEMVVHQLKNDQNYQVEVKYS